MKSLNGTEFICIVVILVLVVLLGFKRTQLILDKIKGPTCQEYNLGERKSIHIANSKNSIVKNLIVIQCKGKVK